MNKERKDLTVCSESLLHLNGFVLFEGKLMPTSVLEEFLFGGVLLKSINEVRSFRG